MTFGVYDSLFRTSKIARIPERKKKKKEEKSKWYIFLETRINSISVQCFDPKPSQSSVHAVFYFNFMPGNMTIPKFTETGNWITDILDCFNYLKNLKYFYTLVKSCDHWEHWAMQMYLSGHRTIKVLTSQQAVQVWRSIAKLFQVKQKDRHVTLVENNLPFPSLNFHAHRWLHTYSTHQTGRKL